MNTRSCRLALPIPGPHAPPLAGDMFEAMLADGDIAALLIPADTPGFSGQDCALRQAAQQKGIACLLAAPDLCGVPDGYDGILFGAGVSARELKQARAELSKQVMIGAETGDSRDEAMHKGEVGIDVIAFAFDGRPEKLGPLCEMAGWWSELFVLPSLVSGNIGIGAATALIRSGVDFIAPADPVWQAPTGPAKALEAYHDLLKSENGS